tara:strand:+ start:7485 stop:8285 length:801 start_codon:yes stop_codon:yes gene_type:complete
MNRYTRTEKKYEKWIKEGRGQGRLTSYKPWLNVQDVSSLGRSHRVLSATTGRITHLLSDLEFYTFLVYDWNSNVVDIREQYPLRRDVTTSIADSLNIHHPRGHQTNMVMSTDLLIDQRSAKHSLLAVQVKPSSELTNRRTREKLPIEKRFWESMNIPFQIVTEKDFHLDYLENLRWLHPSRSGELNSNKMTEESAIYSELLPRFQDQKLSQALAEIDSFRGIEPGKSLSTVRELFARKCFSFPLDKLFYTLKASDVNTSALGLMRC